MRTSILPVAVSCLALGGCPHHRDRIPAGSRLQSEVVAHFERQKHYLGTGFNSALGLLLPTGNYSPCVASASNVTKATLFVPQPYGMLTSGASENFSKRIYRLAVGGTAEVDVAIGEVKAGIEVSTQLEDSALKASYYSTYVHTAGSAVLAEPDITAEGKRVASLDPFEKLRACGDEYLWQVDVGARLRMGLEFTFRSIEDKNRFKANASVELFKKKKELLNVIEELNLHGVNALMNVVFIQEGGDTLRADQIKKATKASCAFSGGGDPSAVLASYEKCLDAFDSLLTYSAKEFPDQIKGVKYDPLNGATANRLLVLKYHTRPYSRAGFPSLNQSLKPKGRVADLLAHYRKSKARWVELNHHYRALGNLFEGQQFLASGSLGGAVKSISVTNVKPLRDKCQDTLARSESTLIRAETELHENVLGSASTLSNVALDRVSKSLDVIDKAMAEAFDAIESELGTKLSTEI